MNEEEKYYVHILATCYELNTLIDAVQAKPSGKASVMLSNEYEKKIILEAICHYFDKNVIEIRNHIIEDAIEGSRRLDITVAFCGRLETKNCIIDIEKALSLEGMKLENVHFISDWIDY